MNSANPETPTTLAAKLRAAGYLEPTGIQMSSDEAHDHALRRCGISNCDQQVTPPADLCRDCDDETEAMARYLRAREAYRRELASQPSLWSRIGNAWVFFAAVVWPRISYIAISMGIVLLTAVALIVGCATAAKGADIPAWVLPGILHEETSSRYIATGAIDYVNRDDGKDGEIGPFQMTPAAFDMVKRSGEQFADLRTNLPFAEDCCRRYLGLLYTDFAERDWFIAVGRWNAGPHGDYGRAWRYAKRAQRSGGGQ